MDDTLIKMLVVSCTISLAIYSRAFWLHNLIERHHPGLNAHMRRTCSWFHRRRQDK